MLVICLFFYRWVIQQRSHDRRGASLRFINHLSKQIQMNNIATGVWGNNIFRKPGKKKHFPTSDLKAAPWNQFNVAHPVK